MRFKHFRQGVAVITLIATLLVIAACSKSSSSMFLPLGGGGKAYWGNWVTNGSVRSIVSSGSTIYFGGNFNQVWANSGGGAVVDTNSGMIPAKGNVPYIAGAVNAVASDGKGGWYIGGTITKVGNSARDLLAHINSDGSLDENWSFDVNGSTIKAIMVSGSDIYIGGTFTQITDSVNTYARTHLARLKSDGTVDPSWFPNPAGTGATVNALALSGNILYVGGIFTTIGGITQNHLASVSTTTGAGIGGWDPGLASGATNVVSDIAVSGNTVYVCGGFTSIGGQSRNYIAGLNTSDALANGFNPNANLPVTDIAVSKDGSIVYAAGLFFGVGGMVVSIGGVSRDYLAALSATTGNAIIDWNPAPDGVVNDVTVSGNAIYVGGLYTTIGGVTRYSAAALDDTGAVTGWAPEPDGGVSAIAVSGGKAYIGGSLTGVCVRDYSGIAAVDGSTGLIKDWDPEVTGGDVEAIAVADGVVYVGGSFDTIGVTPRNYLGGINAATGDVTTFDPNMDNYVYVLKAYRGRLYVGGDFSEYLTCYDLDTGLVLGGWTSPTLDNSVNALEINNGILYVGGLFSAVNGSAAHQYLAALSADDGSRDNGFTPMSALSGGAVYSLLFSNNLLYAGGQFSGTVGGNALVDLAQISTAGTSNAAWHPDPSGGDVFAQSLLNKTLYAGGTFTSAGSVVSTGTLVAAISTEDGLADNAWKPYVNDVIYSLKAYSNLVLVGGNFATVNGSLIFDNIVAIDTKTGLPWGY